jgi:tetratricopeptide (TPR) repeat protein
MIKFNSRSSQRHRGFFIFFGSRGIVSNNGAAVQSACPNCKQQAMIQPKSVRSWFTLFFIPIFPLGAKRIFSQCTNCRAQFRVSPQQLSQHQAASQQQQMQQAIQMYNSLRASPANSVTLNNLLLLYLQLREFNQAVSAANEFQQALNASEQCMTTLGRVLMEQGRHVEAIKWFDSALARNAAIGEAAYCKAVALMSITPPDLAGAAIAARAARTAGLNGAEALLKEIENRSRTSPA